MALEVWFHRCASSFQQLLELSVAAYLTYEAGLTMWRKWERPDKKVEEEFTEPWREGQRLFEALGSDYRS